MKISAIVATGNNSVIGNNGQIPWKLPKDMFYFREITKGSIVIMGRKTFESIGKPLRGRINIVISRDENYLAKGCIVVNSLEEAKRLCDSLEDTELEAFIIGGAEIYRQAIEADLISTIYLTYIYKNFEGDAYFPELSSWLKNWQLISIYPQQPDDKNPYMYDFIKYQKKEG